jgi:hypothetical protein
MATVNAAASALLAAGLLAGCASTDTNVSYSGLSAGQSAAGNTPAFVPNMRQRLALTLANSMADTTIGPAQIEKTVHVRRFEAGAVYSSFLIRYPSKATGIFSAGQTRVNCIYVVQRGANNSTETSRIIVEYVSFLPRSGDIGRRVCGNQEYEDYAELNTLIDNIKNCKAAGGASCAAPPTKDALESPGFMGVSELTPSNNIKKIFVPAAP